MRYSLTNRKKCDYTSTWWFHLSTMEMGLEHTGITVTPGFSGRQAALNIGSDTSKLQGRHLSSSMPSNTTICFFQSPLASHSATFRMLAGRVRLSLSIWQTIHGILQDHVSDDDCERQDMRWITYHPHSQAVYRASTTRFWFSSLHLRMLRSDRTTDLMYEITSSYCPFLSWREILPVRDANGSSTAEISI